MRIVEALFALQEVDFSPKPSSPNRCIEDLRRLVPLPLLTKYDRAARRGRRLVSVVRDGVCTECHVRLPVGTLFEISRGNDCVCDNCGRILLERRAEEQTQAAGTARSQD